MRARRSSREVALSRDLAPKDKPKAASVPFSTCWAIHGPQSLFRAPAGARKKAPKVKPIMVPEGPLHGGPNPPCSASISTDSRGLKLSEDEFVPGFVLLPSNPFGVADWEDMPFGD